ncbi:MAG TPA: YicC/YloC family endoribonuclease [Planctomycetota bacterium]|nr:YicC/YloC family endoribonuclease [Planctomycetota bacterium]
MTGYGEATLEGKNFVISIELKSVNNRFLKVSAKVPEEVAYLQNDLEEHLRRSVLRGSIYLNVRFEPTRSADLYDIDEEVLKKYVKSLNKLAEDLKSKEVVFLKDLLLLPGVVRTEEALVLGKEDVLPVALRALADATRKMTKMRELEGSRLDEEFRARSQTLFSVLAKVRDEAPRALAEYHQKLEERVNGLLGPAGVALAPQDLLKEVAILAERSDICEEIQRFDSHLRQFVETLEEPRAVGRKLEFIVQELFRESNTMSAKSSSTLLNQSIVELKADVDRLKEQVVNVE